jgi:hypothetical protein
MSVLEVGRAYIAGRINWQGAKYSYRSGKHELLLFFDSPSRADVQSVRDAPCEFALALEPPVIFFIYRFGESINWWNAPYSWHMVPAEQRSLPETGGPETQALLHVVLVDAGTGIVCALRAVTFSPEFTRALHAGIREQAESRWPGQAAYDAALADLCRRYPTSADLLRRVSARTFGGSDKTA